MKSMFDLHNVRAVNMQQMDPSDWDVALEEAERDMRVAVDFVASNPAPPTFNNTLADLERAEMPLLEVWNAFGCVQGANATPELQDVMEKWSPRLSALNSDIYQNETLLSRCKNAHAHHGASWTQAQQRVWMRTQRAFQDAGAGLGPQLKEKVRALSVELSGLDTEFERTDLANANVTIPVSLASLSSADPDLLEGLGSDVMPDGQPALRIPVTAPFVEPLLTQLTDRSARQTLWTGWTSRGTGKIPTDQSTEPLIKRILTVRFELAQALGYQSWAEYTLSDQMAQNPERVRAILWDAWGKLQGPTLQDIKVVADFAAENGHSGDLEPWDVPYYTERLRSKNYQVDEETIKQYFPLPHVRAKAFDAAEKVFGVKFTLDETIPVYHPSVLGYHVTRNGEDLGILMIDDHVRPTKGTGAWMNVFASGHQLDRDHNAGVINVLNLAHGTPEKPTLLSQDDVVTIYHELGHALHGLLGQTPHPSQSGTSVSRDFVELPSQIFENWGQSPEALYDLAHHWQTGQPMPVELFDQLQASKKFGQTFFKTAYIQSALVDLELHDQAPPASPFEKEKDVLSSMNAPSCLPPRHHVPHFGHIFGGGYSAGYYSYLWAEVLEADAFSRFKDAGLYDPQTCKDLLALFEAGDAEDPMKLFVAFRGREPEPSALMEKWGVAQAPKKNHALG